MKIKHKHYNTKVEKLQHFCKVLLNNFSHVERFVLVRKNNAFIWEYDQEEH